MIPPIRKPADAADDVEEHPDHYIAVPYSGAPLVFGLGAAVILAVGLALGAWLF